MVLSSISLVNRQGLPCSEPAQTPVLQLKLSAFVLDRFFNQQEKQFFIWAGRPWQCCWVVSTRNRDSDGVPQLRGRYLLHRQQMVVVATGHKAIHLLKTPQDWARLSTVPFKQSSCRLFVSISPWLMTGPPQPTVQKFTLPSSRALYPHSRRVSAPPTPTPPHHSLQEASPRCGSPVFQLPSFQGTLHYGTCFWDEHQLPGH